VVAIAAAQPGGAEVDPRLREERLDRDGGAQRLLGLVHAPELEQREAARVERDGLGVEPELRCPPDIEGVSAVEQRQRLARLEGIECGSRTRVAPRCASVRRPRRRTSAASRRASEER
jgi:hypothetical protein